MEVIMSDGPGSTGNIIAALCSFAYPGLGQLIQGRLMAALVHFVLGSILWWFLLGWLVHIVSAYSAATYK
jgi:TM2 domain-containing membrane protein YozV